MKWRSWTTGVAVFAWLAAAPGHAVAASAAEVAPGDVSRQIRNELLNLPYYGVFDLLTYHMSPKGVVTLGGYVRWGSLKSEAEREVKEVPGVTEVQNKIEILPPGANDEHLRWAVYRAIYRDSFLSRYGTAEDALARPRFWGRGFRGMRPFWREAPFFAMEPLGNHAIHIIVKNGRVILAGEVDNESDKNVAKLEANSVFGVFSIENDLVVAGHAVRRAGRR